MTNEQRYYDALRRIARDYMKPDQLKRSAERLYGLPSEEALEMAYENVLADAEIAIRGRRRPGGRP